jgi:hypothetical protein
LDEHHLAVFVVDAIRGRGVHAALQLLADGDVQLVLAYTTPRTGSGALLKQVPRACCIDIAGINPHTNGSKSAEQKMRILAAAARSLR